MYITTCVYIYIYISIKAIEYGLPEHSCISQVLCWTLSPSQAPTTVQFLLLCCTPEPHETEHCVQIDHGNHSGNS